jgi:cellulose biosynthesis protein BcsQ
MGILLAVANRKGGVGKSTITTMLAHGFAAIGDQRVLVVDLDAQCNSSLIMIGGENWDRARVERRTIADYFDEKMERRSLRPDSFILNDVGDIAARDGKMSLLCGSIDLEEVENELLHNRARSNLDLQSAEQAVISRFRAMMAEFADAFDVVIFDCPPGLSFATKAALGIVHKVIVPFRPDFVSRYAVDRISSTIEGRGRLEDVLAIPKEKRRYIGLVNFWREGGLQRLNFGTIAELHPVMGTRIPEDDGIAEAFDYSGEPQTIDEKYGTGAEIVRTLCKEVVDSIISRYQTGVAA